jgi:hypothetical protein
MSVPRRQNRSMLIVGLKQRKANGPDPDRSALNITKGKIWE